MKNYQTLFKLLIFISGVLCCAVKANTIEKVLVWKKQAIELNLEYPELVTIKTWTNNEVKLTAEVDLFHSDGENLSGNFSWQIDSGKQLINIKADFGEKLANTVLLKSGTDISDGMPDNSMVTATKMIIYVPVNAALSISSTSGSFNIEHPGSDLFVDTIGNVNVSLESQQSATVTASSLMGQIQILSPSMLVKRDEQTQTQNTLTISTKRKLFKLNGGGAETSIVTISGNINITSSSQLEIESLK